jgi:hypothetical protein
MPEQSVVGVYETLAKAEQAVRELDRQGFPLQQVSIIGHDADRELVGSKNQTGLGLCREHGIVWGRMVAIGQITLADPDDGPFVAVVIEIKAVHCHSACGCLPHNA